MRAFGISASQHHFIAYVDTCLGNIGYSLSSVWLSEQGAMVIFQEDCGEHECAYFLWGYVIFRIWILLELMGPESEE